MKIVSPAFLSAIKKIKQLDSLIVIQRVENSSDNLTPRTFIRVCVRPRYKLFKKKGFTFVEADTEIRIANYSSLSMSHHREVGRICFHCHVFQKYSHIVTFLKKIENTSDIKFRILAFNSSQYVREKNFVSHELFGIIDKEYYLLSSYTGPDNSASPVW
jgi:hypothetical protein